MSRFARSLALALLVATTSCHGQFALFKRVQDWNGTLGDKWINSVVHFAFWIVPVYPLTLFADFLVLNTVEFWTGSNPVQAAMLIDEEGNAVALRIPTDQGTYTIHSQFGGHARVYREGTLVGVGEPDGQGGWVFYDQEAGKTRFADAQFLASHSDASRR